MAMPTTMKKAAGSSPDVETAVEFRVCVVMFILPFWATGARLFGFFRAAGIYQQHGALVRGFSSDPEFPRPEFREDSEQRLVRRL